MVLLVIADGIQSVSSKRLGLGSVSVTVTASVTAGLSHGAGHCAEFTRSCELSFEALSLFLAQYTCT
jgi:hypothetical protein